VYLDARGRRITNAKMLGRIRSLVIPPAWTEVWINPEERGHIQATGRDAKGRKQYRYHDEWTRVRGAAKFDSLQSFGLALPSLRARVDQDMRARSLEFDRVVATTVWLLDHTLIRIGNEEYSDSSFGLTSLRCKHVDTALTTLRLRFVGKSGQPHDVTIRDARVARVVRGCEELPGQKLLQYVDGDSVRPVDSRDVNDYIRQAADAEFTSKSFRTWGASSYATGLLLTLGPPVSDKQAEVDVREVVRETAARLRNTPAVCRTSYIHPDVLAGHRTGALHDVRASRRSARWLATSERHLLALLS